MVHSIFCCERDYSISLASLLITKNRAIKIQATPAETGYEEEGKGEKSAKKAVFSEFLFSNILAPSTTVCKTFL